MCILPPNKQKVDKIVLDVNKEGKNTIDKIEFTPVLEKLVLQKLMILHEQRSI
jgi:hypothetical protein